VEPITYAAAGVDVEAGDRAVALMKSAVARTFTREVVGGIGGFAGLFDVSSLRDFRRPLLATSTDGVGTKVAIAQALDRHDTIGFDLVAMVVDDIVVCGARPLFMTDYIACGRVVPERIAQIVTGIADACVEAGCALTGGETAEHPGLLGPDEYDLAGAAVGAVEADQLLGPHRVEVGDVVLALAASGLHSNGYSLVRKVFEGPEWSYDRHVDELGRTLGEELLTPTRIYAQPVVELAAALGTGLHAVSHVTGGGLAANLARVVPPEMAAVIERSTWTPPAVFELVRQVGQVPVDDLERTLNLGVGMVVVLAPEAAERAEQLLAAAGVSSWRVGRVERGGTPPAGASTTLGAKGVKGGAVHVVGVHPR